MSFLQLADEAGAVMSLKMHLHELLLDSDALARERVGHLRIRSQEAADMPMFSK